MSSRGSWVRGAAIGGCVATVLGLAAPDPSMAQGKYFGFFGSIGGAVAGSGRRVNGEMGSAAVIGRGSSTTRDAIGGFAGVFSSQATVSFTTQAGEFSLIGLPITPSNPAFGALFEELGAADVAQWRLGHWAPADSAYQEAAANSLGPIVTGEGLWLITRDARSASATGLPAPRTTFDLRLGAGPNGQSAAWNQIANPFLFPIAVSALQVTNGAQTFALTNPANTLTEPVAKVWNSAADAYVDATVVNGRGGFWVKRKAGAGTVRVLIPHVASTTGSPAPSLRAPEQASWAVGIVARQGERACEPLMLGVADVPAGGYNALSRSQAPHPPGRFLSLVVPRRDWGALSDRYVGDFRSPEEPAEWDVALSGGATPGEIALEATGLGLPEGMRLVLEDPRDGWSREIVPGGGAVTLLATEAERHLRLRAVPGGSTVSLAPAPDGLRHVYPSPFASRAGLALSLARGGDLTVDVFDALGRRVRSLERRGAAAGEHVLVWDGRDASGHVVAPGVYLARWSAGASRGTARLVKIE